MIIESPILRLWRRAGVLALGLALSGAASGQSYVNQPLPNNVCCTAPHFDPQLRAAWGVTFGPTGPAWVSAPFAARAQLLEGTGNTQASVTMAVPPQFNGGFVTGSAFSGGDEFLVPNGLGDSTPA